MKNTEVKPQRQIGAWVLTALHKRADGQYHHAIYSCGETLKVSKFLRAGAGGGWSAVYTAEKRQLIVGPFTCASAAIYQLRDDLAKLQISVPVDAFDDSFLEAEIEGRI